MSDNTADPYTVREEEAHPPPTSLTGRLSYLGPSLIVTGAVIGSGELVLDQPWCRSRLVPTLVAGPVLLVQISCSGRACKVHHSIWGHLLKGNQPPSWSHLANLLANLARSLLRTYQEPSDLAYLEAQEKLCLFFYLTWTLS